MTTSVWPSHEPILKAAGVTLKSPAPAFPPALRISGITLLSGRQPKQLERL